MKTKLFLMCSTIVCLSANATGNKYQYPETRKDNVVDHYFGTDVADPYRWLENDTSAETTAWVAAQRKTTSAYLNSLPYRDEIRTRLSSLMNYEKYGCPTIKNGHYYYQYNSGLQNQSVIYKADSPDDKGEVLLDPNALSSDGTVALNSSSLSEDGKYLAYTISRSGSDWVEIYVMETATKKLLPDHIKWAKFTGAAWYKDGFFYSAYDAPKGNEYSGKNENHKIFYHKIGTPQSSDQLIYENPQYPLRFYTAATDERNNILFMFESGAGNGNGLYIKDLSNPESKFVCISDSQDFSISPIEIFNGKLYILTNLNAPNNRLVATDLNNPYIENWKDILPEKKDVLSSVSLIGGKLIAVYDKDASNHAYIHDLSGKQIHEVKLPTIGTVAFSGKPDSKETYYAFSSFTYPTAIYKYDMETNKSSIYRQPSVSFNPEDYVTEQVFVTSKDGTQVPMTLTYKKGMERNGKNPAYIYGYGGFNITLYPSFSANRMFLLENGFIYAQVNMRGGNEYGEKWHLAGTKMQKQNVFDDFISAAEYLIKENYTNSDMLVAEGGSNGGLLIGACVNQRPDLFSVAIPRVGVMDMLRYHKFTIGWNWAPDYGTSEDSKEMFEYLKSYSPLHNIKNDGTHYPAILVTTADHDDRVVPAHSFKYAAMLQASNTGDRPKFIRIDSKAGHGGGKPTAKVIDEYVDIYSFILSNLGLSLKK